MADKCIVFINEQQQTQLQQQQQGHEQIVEQNQSSDSLLSTDEVKTAIVVNEKFARNKKSILNCADAVTLNKTIYGTTAAHTPTYKTSTTTTTLPNDNNNSASMNAQLETVIDEVKLSPSSSSSLSSSSMTAAIDSMEDTECVTTKTSTTQSTTPLMANDECDYLKENDDDEEEISERNHDLLFRGVSANQNEKNVYLETPVLDDNNELLDMDSAHHHHHHHHHYHHHHHFCKRTCNNLDGTGDVCTPKPKRLSDEFYSGDDADTEELFDDDEDGVEQKLPICNGIDADDLPNDNNNSSETVNERIENLIENNNLLGTIVELNRSSVMEDEISTCSLNLLSDIVANQQNHQEHLDDSSSPHSSVSPAEIIENQKECVSVADVVEELTNQGDEHQHQQHRIVIENNIFFNNNSSSNINNNVNDVQSMDAIERRDFINEQVATGNCLLGTNSLIINRTNGEESRLNINLLGNNNTFANKMDQIVALADKQTIKRDADDKILLDKNNYLNSQGNSTSTSGKLVTTPTSSRMKRSRLNLCGESSNGLNLTKNLEKCPEPQQSSKSIPLADNSNDSLSSDNQFPIEDESIEPTNQMDHGEGRSSVKKALSEQGDLNCAVCSSCNKDDTNDDDDLNDIDDNDDDDIDEDMDDEEEEEIAEDLAKPSTSKAASTNRNNCCDCYGSPRTRSWRFGVCSNACKNKQNGTADVIATGIVSTAANTATASTSSFHRSNGNGTSSNNDNDDANIASNFKVMMGLEPDNPYADWSCDVNSDGEEVCTCRDYTDDEVQGGSSEDELPSRDVDLSCYSISEDMLNSNGNASTETPTSRNHRKRKLTESRSTIYTELNSSCNEISTNDRKRLALENVSHKLNSSTNQPTTPTTTNSSLALRTPRSVIPTRDNPPPELSDWLDQFKQWSHVERLVAVDHLIEHCEPTQVRHMMKVIEPQFQRDFISLLPKELALQVLSYLTPNDLLRAAQTCRSWRFLCDDNLLWKEKCKQSSICIESSTDRPKRGRVGSMPPISSPWKAAYMRQHIIEMNWRSRPIREPKTLRGHDDHVITCLQFCGNRIVSGSDDNTLSVWSAITGKCLRTLRGHTGGVWSSQMSANIIISGSTDRTLKVWNADNGSCIHTLSGHTSTVRCMHLHEKK